MQSLKVGVKPGARGNKHRMDLTPSEKVEIAGIEEAMTGRNHRPIKSAQNFTELSPLGESRDIVAKSVDMNRETYRQAKAVVDFRNDELIRQIDSGEKSIHAI